MATNLRSSIVHGKRASNFCCTAAINNAIVTNQISDNAHGVVQRPLGFFNDHLVASSNKHSHGSNVGAFFNDKHLFLGGAKVQFADQTSCAKFGSAQVFESGDNATICSNGNELIKVKQVPCQF
jgi:hypothetical protein